jgi:hypothetical protein
MLQLGQLLLPVLMLLMPPLLLLAAGFGRKISAAAVNVLAASWARAVGLPSWSAAGLCLGLDKEMRCGQIACVCWVQCNKRTFKVAVIVETRMRMLSMLTAVVALPLC